MIDQLEDLGRHLAYPEADLADPVTARLQSPSASPRRREPNRVWVLAAAAVAVVALVLAVPTSRRAVARWFGIGTVQFDEVPSLPDGIGQTLQLGEPAPVDITEAPDGLGEPDAAFTGEPTPDSVTLVWAPSDDLPAVGATGVGALLSMFEGEVDDQLVKKELQPDTVVESVRVRGTTGFWITGAPHTFAYRDANGDVRFETTRLVTGNTLLWVEDGVTYRFESALSLDRALASLA